MSITSDRRLTRVAQALAAALSIPVALAAAQAAQASTIHACVKPKSGATRIVGAKTKCHQGEQKLSWNTSGAQGPAGPTGAPGAAGAEGKPGANGSGIDFVAVKDSVALPKEVGTVVLTKVLPPGAYDFGSKTVLVGVSGTKSFTQVLCEIEDSPGTTGVGEQTIEDASGSVTQLAELEPGEFLSNDTLVLEGSFSSKATSTLTVVCENSGSATVSAAATTLNALNVTAIE